MKIADYLLCIIESPVFHANNIDPDQTPHFVASALFESYASWGFSAKMGLSEMKDV